MVSALTRLHTLCQSPSTLLLAKLTRRPNDSSVEILFLGITPIIWSPISERIGRRPVYLISALVSAACALGGAYCRSYGTLMTTRVFQAIFIAPPQSIGACTVSEMFFAHQKGRKMGVWGECTRKSWKALV